MEFMKGQEQFQYRDLIPQGILAEVQRKLGNMTAIIEVATTCNLACDYCFASRPVASIMTPQVVDKIIEGLLLHNGKDEETKFIWHGGEPLLAGISFYEHVLETERRFISEGYRCVNSMQTNGILLDEKWIDFLRDNAFGVGSSLDGLPELHDARRRDRHNRPTYDAVVRNLQKAKERGLPIGVICVINRDTVPHVEAIYENLKTLGLPFTMSPVTPNHGQTLAAQPLTPEEYTEVLIRLFDVWFDDPQPTVPVNPPNSILQGIIYGGMPFYCSADDSCFSKFVSFLPDGSVYPCNRFAGEPTFFLGNILEESLGAILSKSPRQALMDRTKEKLEPCASCESSPMCRGGCAHHAFAFHGHIMMPDYYCQSFFKAFSYYRDRLTKALAEAEIDKDKKEEKDGTVCNPQNEFYGRTGTSM
jgi:uncharacterized protein